MAPGDIRCVHVLFLVQARTSSEQSPRYLLHSPQPVMDKPPLPDTQLQHEMPPPSLSPRQILTCGPQAGLPWSVRPLSPSASAGRSQPSAGSPPLSTCGAQGPGGLAANFRSLLQLTPTCSPVPGHSACSHWQLLFCRSSVILSQCILSLPLLPALPSPPHSTFCFLSVPSSLLLSILPSLVSHLFPFLPSPPSYSLVLPSPFLCFPPPLPPFHLLSSLSLFNISLPRSFLNNVY